MKIPFSPPFVDQDVINEVLDSLNSGWITSGPKVKALEEEVCKLTKVSHTVCVNSWTSGAILVLKWFGVKEGDEVIIPAYTYSATALAVLQCGATPVMVDVSDDFTINTKLLQAAITNKTKVIMPVDIAGWPCDYDSINELVNEKYKDVPYEDWDKLDPLEIQSYMNESKEPYIQMANHFKYAGWFDLYSKAFVEELLPIPDEWKGYGPWDYYGMLILDMLYKKGRGTGNQYILKNQIIFEQHPDKNNKNNFINYYKDMLVLNEIEDQRKNIDSKFPYYIDNWIEYAKNKNI